MQRYEISYLIPIESSEEERKSLSERVISSIQQNGGILEDTRQPIMQNLAHPIKKAASAFLVSLNFLIVPEKIAEIEGKLKSEPSIIRYFLAIKKSVKAGKKAPRRLPKSFAPAAKEPVAEAAAGKEKVELQEIDKKLEEILGQ